MCTCIYKYNKTKDIYLSECDLGKCQYYQVNADQINTSCKLNKIVIKNEVSNRNRK